MPAKLVTYNSQNYAGTLGSGLAWCHSVSTWVMHMHTWMYFSGT